MNDPIRLAVVGGHRGGSFGAALEAFADKIRLVAVCDIDDRVLGQWAENHPDVETTASYESLLDDPNVDAVLLATPMMLHARQAVQAMNAGKHVLSEVIAATSLEECWELVETVERTGLTYMMSENYCYRRETMMVKHMAEQGAFGDLTFAEGAYIHDTRDLLIKKDGQRAWRAFREASQISRANTYPTHSLGPVSQWLGITRGDRFLRTTTFVTKSVARHEWAMSVLPEDHPDANPAAWARAADSASTLIETALGRVIVLRKDSASPRPHNMVHYGIQGTRGAFISQRHDNEDPLVWLDGSSPGVSPWNPGYTEMLRPEGYDGPRAEWQTLWECVGEYEHPRWKARGREAMQAGHGGGDFFVIEDFADAVHNGTPPPIDVYDAVTWSCIMPLSAQNVESNGIPLEVPDFMRGKPRPAASARDADRAG